MAENILLINPNRMKPAVAPIALDYLASALEDRHFHVDILDLCFSTDWAEDIARYFREKSAAVVGITLRNTDDTSLSSQEFFIPAFKDIIDCIREQTPAPLIVGGSGFSIMPEAILDYTGLDMGITGDGEYSLPLLAETLVANEDFRSVPGLVYRIDGGFRRNPPSYIDMASFPTPGRDYIDNRRYYREGGMGSVEAKRGCNMGCIYCADPLVKGRTSRLRPPKSVVDEMESLLGMGINTLHFCDSEFNLPKIHADEICVELIRRRLFNRIKWYTYASPLYFPVDLAVLFKKAGCAGLNFGIDSGSERLLHNLGRKFRVEDIRNVAGFCHWHGIDFIYDLLLGGPGETRDTLRETIELMKDISPSRIGAALGVRIFPGTELADMVKAMGPLEQNPNLRGKVSGNDNFFYPVFYLSSDLGEDPHQYLADLIGGDERFFFMSPRQDNDRNYNYNDNSLLQEAIQAGYRGAFWDILRRYSIKE